LAVPPFVRQPGGSLREQFAPVQAPEPQLPLCPSVQSNAPKFDSQCDSQARPISCTVVVAARFATPAALFTRNVLALRLPEAAVTGYPLFR
jgi:hypothetical protein